MASIEGHIFRSHKTDGGYSEIANLGSRINHLKMASDQVGYLTLSSASGPYKSVDSGSTWSEVLNWAENNPVHVYNDNVFLTANTNRYFVSVDGGATSTAHYMFDDTNAGLIENVTFTEDGTFYMVGESSTVLKSSDFGESYENLLLMPRADLFNIDFRGNSAIATGYNSILISNDNGVSWTEFMPDGLENTNDGVALGEHKYAIASDNGISIIDNGSLISTTGSNADRIYASSDNDYLLANMRIGASHVIAKSVDNGATWSNKIFNTDYLGNIKSNSEGLLYTTSGEGKYLQSTDDGETWTEITLPVNNFFLDIAILGETALYSIGGTLYESKDNGATLTQLASGYLINNLYILNEDHYTYTSGSSSNTIIYEKRPGEDNFEIVARSCGNSKGSYYKENGEMWYSKDGGHIAKYDFDINANAITQINHNTLSIYPNPINVGESLFINDVDKESLVVITDNIGRVVVELKLSDYEIELDTKHLIPGNYFLTIKNKDSIQSGKLLVF